MVRDNLPEGNMNMPDKDPTNWGWAVWALAIGMSVAGGIINWYGKVRAGHTRAFSSLEFAIEVFTSGFIGLAVFMGLDSFGQPIGLCAALAGVGGHMSTRLLFPVEKIISSKINNG